MIQARVTDVGADVGTLSKHMLPLNMKPASQMFI
jgi:hypothetical protein